MPVRGPYSLLEQPKNTKGAYIALVYRRNRTDKHRTYAKNEEHIELSFVKTNPAPNIPKQFSNKT